MNLRIFLLIWERLDERAKPISLSRIGGGAAWPRRGSVQIPGGGVVLSLGKRDGGAIGGRLAGGNLAGYLAGDCLGWESSSDVSSVGVGLGVGEWVRDLVLECVRDLDLAWRNVSEILRLAWRKVRPLGWRVKCQCLVLFVIFFWGMGWCFTAMGRGWLEEMPWDWDC